METNNTIMTPSDFTNFLDAGAILRVSADDWFLLKGPFKSAEKTERGQIALFSPEFFASPNPSYWLPTGYSRLTTLELSHLCEVFNDSPTHKAPEWIAAKLQNFQDSFAQIQQRIEKATLKKAVPIVFETTKAGVHATRLGQMLRQLVSAPPSLFVYGFWQNGVGTLGASPEVLLRQQGTLLTTMALAGTRPKQDGERASLLNDAKEMYEHELVVQDIQQVLAKFGELESRGPQILELPSLQHLKTDIECRLSDPNSFEFFEACRELHPTAALGVSPRSAGFEWMRDLPEQAGRKGFGAPWGLKWGNDEALCLVAIRNLQWDKSGSRIGSGCGIVAQSQPDQEWRELSQKRQSVKKILGLDS